MISCVCISRALLRSTHSDAPTGTCPLVITRTYSVTDACLNVTTAVHTINVDDNTAPVVTGTIATTNVEGCDASAAPAAVSTVAALEGLGLTISDVCTSDANLVVTHSDAPTGTCPLVITRTYSVTDACLNVTTAVHTINVDDNTAPVVTGTIATTNVEGCDASAAPAAVSTVAALEGLGLTISDVCTSDANLVVTHSYATRRSSDLVITRTYSVTDACLNVTTAVHTINVDDNTAPVVTGTIATTNVEGCDASAAPAAVSTVAALEGLGLTISDVCTSDANLVVTHSDAPTGTCPLVITRTYSVTDACLNVTTAVHTINVDDNTAPVVTGTIATTNVEGCDASAAPAAVSTVAALEGLGLTISDVCTSDANLVVTHSYATRRSSDLVITRTYSVTDACLNVTTAVHTINVDDNTAPVVTGTIATTNVEGCDASAAPAAVSTVAALEGLGLTISDVCTSDANLVVTHSDAPTGTCPLVITRTYSVTDACLNVTTAVHTINVDDNTAPVVTGTIATTNVEGCDASAAPAAVSTVAALEGLGLTISDVCTSDANLVVTHSYATRRSSDLVITRTYSVTDACLNVTTAVHTINVDDNTAPVVTGTIATTNVEGCDASAAPAAVSTVAALEALGLTISDVCTSDANLVVTHSDAPTGTCPLVITRTYSVTDACLNVTTAVHTINVDDNTAPVVTGTIATTNVEGCDASAAPAAVSTVAALEALGLTISDVCTSDANLVVTHSDAPTGTCPLVITRTYSVTDACLNVTTAVHTINVDDNTAPVVTGTIATTNVEGCDASPAPALVSSVAALEALGLTISDVCTSDANLVVTHRNGPA